MSEIKTEDLLKPVQEEHKKEKKHRNSRVFSLPLLEQSFKANFGLWIALTLGLAAVLAIINLVLNSKTIFTNINMSNVSVYVRDQGMNWLQILGLLETMGFNLSRIQVMSSIDMNAIMSDLIYKIAGILLPMIYIIIVSNKLIASQVDSGSLAYVLSTPTNRRKVVRTQYFFLIVSLFAMYIVATIAGVASEIAGWALNPNHTAATFPNPVRTILYCFGSFMAVFALGGICFAASAICNRSKNSIAIGGGICVFSFLSTILGLFGSKVFVAVGVGVEAMNFFNYVSILTLFDTEATSAFAKWCVGADGGVCNMAWLWKDAILLAVGIAATILGDIRFTKKDLPL